MTASLLARAIDDRTVRNDAIAWCLRDQDSARFHAEAARYIWAEGNLRRARIEQDLAAFYSRLARIGLLRLLGTISAYEQDVEMFVEDASNHLPDERRRTCCGHPLIGKVRFLELDQRTDTYHDRRDVPEEKSQGWFPFGLSCAKTKMSTRS